MALNEESVRRRTASIKQELLVSSDHSNDNANDSDGLTPFTPPSFTIKELRNAIPKHCFERSALRSSTYVAADITLLACFVYAATYIDQSFSFDNGSILDGRWGALGNAAAWLAYFVCSGCVGTGLWVLAHECGHQAFSTSKTLNNTVGFILHSFLLVPYHSWRISHGRHHAACGSMERDEVFVPKTQSQVGAGSKDKPQGTNEEVGVLERMEAVFEDAPLWNLSMLFLRLTLGFPLYLVANCSGQNYGRWTSHFDPTAPIFDKRHFWQIVISDVGIISTISALITWSHYRTSEEVVKYYLIPYLIVNSLLVLFTYLQHSDPLVPHYRKEEWNFQRGALCTVDRNLGGKLGEYLFHGICETHVAHHICSKIPHYHAWEATEALKTILGGHYMKSEDNMYRTLYRNYSACKYVEDEGSCVFYKDRKGKALRKVVYDLDSGVDIGSCGSSDSEKL